MWKGIPFPFQCFPSHLITSPSSPATYATTNRMKMQNNNIKNNVTDTTLKFQKIKYVCAWISFSRNLVLVGISPYGPFPWKRSQAVHLFCFRQPANSKQAQLECRRRNYLLITQLARVELGSIGPRSFMYVTTIPSVESHVERDRSMQCTVGNELENRPRGCYVSIPNKVNSQFHAKSETINFQFR